MQKLHESIRIWSRVLNAEYLINMQQFQLILNINNSKYLIIAFNHSQAHEIYVSRIFQPELRVISGKKSGEPLVKFSVGESNVFLEKVTQTTASIFISKKQIPKKFFELGTR